MRCSLLLLAALLLIAVLVSGCGKQETTYTTPEGEKVTVTKEGPKGGTVEIEGKEGKAKITTEAKPSVTEEELGVPVYPGAKLDGKSSFESAGRKSTQYVLSTTDSFEDVESFYKSNLKDAQGSYTGSGGDAKTVLFLVDDGTSQTGLTIVAEKGKDKTIISVSRSTK